MRILLATFASPTYTNELYDWSLVDLAQMYEVRAFMDHEQAITWANEQIQERNAEIAKENVECAEYGEPAALYEFFDDRMEGEERIVLWTEEGDVENTTPSQTYVLVMKWQELNAE